MSVEMIPVAATSPFHQSRAGEIWSLSYARICSSPPGGDSSSGSLQDIPGNRVLQALGGVHEVGLHLRFRGLMIARFDRFQDGTVKWN